MTFWDLSFFFFFDSHGCIYKLHAVLLLKEQLNQFNLISDFSLWDKNFCNKAQYKAEFWPFVSIAVEHLNLSECHHYCYINIYCCNIILSNATHMGHTPCYNNKAYHTLITVESETRVFTTKDGNTAVKELQIISSFSCS